jgi:hypothetical protein
VMLLACSMNFYITFFKLFVPMEITVLLEQRSRHSTALSSASAGTLNISLLLYHSRFTTFKLSSVMPALSLSVLQMHSRSFQVSLLQLNYVLTSPHMLAATQVSFALSLATHKLAFRSIVIRKIALRRPVIASPALNSKARTVLVVHRLPSSIARYA